jgi:hypothetical protein
MMCQRSGLPPISTMGFGRTNVSSLKSQPSSVSRNFPVWPLIISDLFVAAARGRCGERYRAGTRGSAPPPTNEGLATIYPASFWGIATKSNEA